MVLGVSLKIIYVLSTLVCAVMMVCFGGIGAKFDEYLGFKAICVCSYDAMLWWFWGNFDDYFSFKHMCVCVQLCLFCVFLGVVLKIISVLSTVARAAMMVCADGFGVDFDDYLRVKYICVCSNDVRFLWFWEYV